MSSKETEYTSEAEAPTPGFQDPETAQATFEEILVALEYDDDALDAHLQEALKPVEEGWNHVIDEETLLGGKFESWKNKTRESWSLEITDSIEVASHYRSWISRAIANAYSKTSLTEGLNARIDYFCGMHYGRRDSLKALTLRMMKCLLAQLLINLRNMTDSDEDSAEDSAENIEWTRLQIKEGAANDLPTVLKAFENVYSRYPDNALLHIIIDHLHLHWDTDDEEGQECILAAMEMFKKLIKDKEKKVFLKLVLTSSEKGAFFWAGPNCEFEVDYVNVFDAERFPKWVD